MIAVVSRTEPLANAGVAALAVLEAKQTVPAPAPTLVARPRLTARLRQSASARLPLMVAPAGSGKSSLVSQWCQAPSRARELSLL